MVDLSTPPTIRCPYCGSHKVMELRWFPANNVALYESLASEVPEDYTGEMACNDCCSVFSYEDTVPDRVVPQFGDRQ